jgi:hypothetical protein
MKKLYFLFFVGLCSSGLFAQPLGWTHTQTIAVTENSGANIYGYQLKITFDSQVLINAGDMNNDGSDLRFGTQCDTTDLNYWIESGINTPSTVVWVNIDTLLASQVTNIFMFYGNVSATSVSAVNGTFYGPHSATDSVASGGAGGATSSQRGFRFAPNQDLLVTSFGKREPNGTPRYITLFDFATQAIVQQTQVSGPAAQYSYGSLSSPIWLTQGTQYVLELYQGASDGYYFGTSSQIGQHLTYLDMRYCNSCTQNTFPTNTLSNYHYGYPDLWYYTKQTVTPAPTYALSSAFSVSLGPDSAFCASATLDAGNPGSTYLWSNTASTQTINITASGTYAVLVTTPQNCAASDTVNVVIHPNPVVDLGPDTAYCTGTTLDAGAGYTYEWLDNSTNQTLDVALTGTYGVEIADTNTCTGADTIFITIHGLPPVVATVSPDTVACAGDSLDFAGVGANTYTWNNGIVEGLNAVSIGGNYIVTGTDLNGCENTDTISITVHSLPSVAFSFLTDSVCVTYAPIVLSGGLPGGGTYSGTGVTAGNFDPATGVGNYTLIYTYTDGNGCTSSDTESMLVTGCLGNEVLESNILAVYPNPTSGLFNIQLKELEPNTSLRVYNMLGKVVYTTQVTTINTIIDLQVKPGNYIVELVSGTKAYRQQLIVQ